MKENYRVVAIGNKPSLRSAFACKTTASILAHQTATPLRDVKTSNLLHHLIRTKDAKARMAILNQLAVQDTRQYSTILLQCAEHSILFGHEYDLLKYFAKAIGSNDYNAEACRTLACALIRNRRFLDADCSLDFLLALGPFEATSSLYSAVHAALGTHPHLIVRLWDSSICLGDNPVDLPPGMLLDFVRMTHQNANRENHDSFLVEIARVLRRLAVHPCFRKEMVDVPDFPENVVCWLCALDNAALTDTAADIMASTSFDYKWCQHRDVRKRLWALAVDGRALAAVIKIVAPSNTKLSLIHSIAKHINVDDVNVDESSILAAQAVKIMIQSLSARVKTYPESLDLLSTLTSAKNRHVRFWAAQGLSEQSQRARFYLARSNQCLRALLVSMKKDRCFRVRAASTNAICNICKDPANAMTLIRRSDVLPSLVDSLWKAVERAFPVDVCNRLVEALLALVCNKVVDPDRLANTYRLVDSLIKYGNQDNEEYDDQLQLASLKIASLLEPFRQFGI